MRIDEQYYLIIDLEATCCDRGTVPREEMEIIEIGAVMQDARTFDVVSEFQQVVRPVRHPVLTGFCRALTGTTQADVDAGVPYADALSTLTAWAAPFDDHLFCSWGNYDRRQFQQDCAFHDVEYPFGTRHLNLKEEFARATNSRRNKGLSGALAELRLEFSGQPHRGLDDARNIARIVRRVCLGA
ncbi:MAG: exonuclease domain-containing protein [Planctomycetaceae bacterium]|nr:exonuclease domain-containing protein [Planctomycetaceae bacterium]